MKLVNLTRHTIELMGDGRSVGVVPSGHLARMSSVNVQDGWVDAGEGLLIPVYVVERRGVEGVPDPEADTIFIASGLVAQFAGRADVVAPIRMVRGSDGDVRGSRGLLRYH